MGLDVSSFSQMGLNPYSSGWSNSVLATAEKDKIKLENNDAKDTSKDVSANGVYAQAAITNPPNEKLLKAAIAVTAGSAVVATTSAVLAHKNVKNVTNSMKNLTDNSQKLRELEEKLTELLSKAKKPRTTTTVGKPRTTGKKTSNKALITALVAALGLSAGAITGKEFPKKHREVLAKEGISEDDIKLLEEASIKNRDSIEQANNVAYAAMDRANNHSSVLDGATQSMNMHRHEYYGLNLLHYHDGDKNVDSVKRDLAIKNIRKTGEHYLNRTAEQATKEIKAYRNKYSDKLDPNSVWSITSEFAPIKIGGLGVVPVELQDNFVKSGVDNPVFIPMYLEPGKAEFKEVATPKGTTTIYNYNGTNFPVTKFASMPLTTYNGTVPTNHNIEFYLGHPQIPDKKNPKIKVDDLTRNIVFVKDSATFSSDLYKDGMQGHEKMKFAVLDKAVYQLAKQKVSEAFNPSKNTGVMEFEITDKKTYDKIKAPISMVLNDWHAANLSGLMRYKPLMESAYKELDSDVAEAMRKMPMLMIGHNAGISGATFGYDLLTENVLNTLFDRYTFEVLCNANSGYQKLTGDELTDDTIMNKTSHGNALFFNRNESGMRGLDSLATGLALADWFVPVSKNYSEELRAGIQESGTAYALLEKRAKAGNTTSSYETLKNSTAFGIVNGLDKDINSVKSKVKEGFMAPFANKMTLFDENDSIETIMAARNANKMVIGKDIILKNIINSDEILLKDVENDLTLNELARKQKVAELRASIAEKTEKFNKEFNESTPVISFAHRLTSQKGLDIFSGAVIKLFNEWENLFPDKPRPFVIAGGPLEEVHQKNFLDKMGSPASYNQNARGEAWKVVTKAGNMPNPLLYSGSTYFCAPSTYEPCGLIQGESFAMGLPVITTKTGGYVDTVVDYQTAKTSNLKPNGFVSEYKSKETIKKENPNASDRELYNIWLNSATENYFNKLVEALRVYYNDSVSGDYSKMVEHNLKDVDFSWSQNKENDPIHQYLNKLGIDKPCK